MWRSAGLPLTALLAAPAAGVSVPVPALPPRGGREDTGPDECVAGGEGRAACERAGQRCVSGAELAFPPFSFLSPSVGWACACAAPEETVRAAPGEIAVCRLRECSSDGAGRACAAVGQLCVEGSVSPARRGDWSCNCDTAKGLVGSRRGAVADCHKLVSISTTIQNVVDKSMVTSPAFIAGFEAAVQTATGAEATVTDVKQHRSIDDSFRSSHELIMPDAETQTRAPDATRIEAVLVVGPDNDTRSVKAQAALTAETVAALLNMPAGVVAVENAAADVIECGENERAAGGRCARCPEGSISPPGSRADEADTRCVATLCEANEYVYDHMCIPCVAGLWNARGDSAAGNATRCGRSRRLVAQSGDAHYEMMQQLQQMMLQKDDTPRRADAESSPPPLLTGPGVTTSMPTGSPTVGVATLINNTVTSPMFVASGCSAWFQTASNPTGAFWTVDDIEDLTIPGSGIWQYQMKVTTGNDFDFDNVTLMDELKDRVIDCLAPAGMGSRQVIQAICEATGAVLNTTINTTVPGRRANALAGCDCVLIVRVVDPVTQNGSPPPPAPSNGLTCIEQGFSMITMPDGYSVSVVDEDFNTTSQLLIFHITLMAQSPPLQSPITCDMINAVGGPADVLIDAISLMPCPGIGLNQQVINEAGCVETGGGANVTLPHSPSREANALSTTVVNVTIASTGNDTSGSPPPSP